MATEYKIIVLPDTGGTRPCIECPPKSAVRVFHMATYSAQFVMMMYNVVSEKDLMLRQGLKLIGLKDSIYWISW